MKFNYIAIIVSAFAIIYHAFRNEWFEIKVNIGIILFNLFFISLKGFNVKNEVKHDRV